MQTFSLFYSIMHTCLKKKSKNLRLISYLKHKIQLYIYVEFFALLKINII